MFLLCRFSIPFLYLPGAGHGWLGHYPTSLMDAMRKSIKSDATELPPAFKAFMLAGAYVSKYYGYHFYAKGMNLRRRIRQEYDDVMKRYDVIITPTTGQKPQKLPTASSLDNDNVKGKITSLTSTFRNYQTPE